MEQSAFLADANPNRRAALLSANRVGYVAGMPTEYSNDWIDLSALSEREREEFEHLRDPAIVRGYGEFAEGELSDRWIELYLKAAKARLKASTES
jgi:hypothetical protein